MRKRSEEDEMDSRPIKSGEDYRATLEEIDSLIAAEPGTPAGERLDVLVTLVEAYERKHLPLDLPDPVGEPGRREP
jgi:HTH-type transcriptional regulator / antitoxin HigA